MYLEFHNLHVPLNSFNGSHQVDKKIPCILFFNQKKLDEHIALQWWQITTLGSRGAAISQYNAAPAVSLPIAARSWRWCNWCEICVYFNVWQVILK